MVGRSAQALPAGFAGRGGLSVALSPGVPLAARGSPAAAAVGGKSRRRWRGRGPARPAPGPPGSGGSGAAGSGPECSGAGRGPSAAQSGLCDVRPRPVPKGDVCVIPVCVSRRCVRVLPRALPRYRAAVRVTEPWNRLSREAVQSASLGMLKNRLDSILCRVL